MRGLFALAGRAGGPTLPPPETFAPHPDPFAKLARLNELRLAGALTDEEFAVQKQLLLERISSGQL
ncbi:MAG TPA: SHOCT domain-containing protein [Solirubrobacteraceae bacterium]|nr:SHOCT domain-containing protein [Solirubrobacteraceae bacterium]